MGARVERSLANTNDFGLPLSNDPGFAALLGSVDNYDYVDRRTALLTATRVLRSVDVGLVTLQLGVGEDRIRTCALSSTACSATEHVSVESWIAEGRYAIGSPDVELHPNVTGDFVQPGIGARIHYENATGDIDWQRAELTLSARRYLGPLSFAMHADGGIVLGARRRRNIVRARWERALPGYEYKQFAGDRAALLRAFASYRFNIWRSVRCISLGISYLPAFKPGFGRQRTSADGQSSRRPAPSLPCNQFGSVMADPLSDRDRRHARYGRWRHHALLGPDSLGVARPVDRAAP